ncbi:hypothetical protein N7468_009016 [Penicillium chermesinum]|uniref:PAP-associated domain-containing protein n=1 Tax=Penicillium chermesinum TaxID=63820 RepID=A0A9W9TEG3_9EURO|nr:uncharacterized protein N7468_009016 [Penicillium chermesinum]KAJ5219812.1 hypothetical protein N7468_009016 [Penicillium chermesinum]
MLQDRKANGALAGASRRADFPHYGTPPNLPWLSYLPRSAVAGDASMYLDAELQALSRYLAPSQHEQDQIHRIIGQVGALIERVVPYSPQLIGPHRTGLALAHSNVSLLLRYDDVPRSLDNSRRPSATRPQIKEAHMNLLRRVESALQATELFNGLVKLQGKRRPFLEARHQPTGLLLNFRCDEGVPVLTEYLQGYSEEYPALRPLYTAARTLLEAHSLFGDSHASIEPDALALLVVAFLKTTHGRFPGYSRLGDQFLGFLQLYGMEVNLSSVGVAADPPGFFSIKTLRTPPTKEVEPAHLRGQRSLINAKHTAAVKGNRPASRRLCVQDPSHYMNNLGRSCTRVVEMQRVFAKAHERLVESLGDWDSQPKKESILKDGLHANFAELERFRRRMILSAHHAEGSYV